MKQFFTIILSVCILSVGINSQANNSTLPQGEYRITGYTLENNGDVRNTGNNGYGGASFYTLYILPEAMDTVLNRGEDLYGKSLINTGDESLKGFAIKAAYAPTSNLTFHSALGLTDMEKNKEIDYSERVGWEVDLGVAYKLLHNVTYEIHFGYMDTGELFKKSNSYMDVEDITIITNKLTMSF